MFDSGAGLSEMNILFQSRKTLFSVPGGDTIQVLKTSESLRSLGCKVDITTDLEPNLSGYDLVHLFNLIRPQEVYLQALNAKRQCKPVALSPIYVDYSEYERRGRSGIARIVANLLTASQLEYLKVVVRAVKNREGSKGTVALVRQGFHSLQKKIIAMTDILLPNSASEMCRVATSFPECSNFRHVVVPNAVDTCLFNSARPSSKSEYDSLRGCVLSVGRIEGRKCQLALVRAMRGLPWKLVLVGKPAPNHRGYYEQIVREAGPNVHIVGEIPHEKLPEVYRVARVHCLVSWMETTGLSSLEAGVMGCNLVITDRGDTRDYFGDYAFYCEPDSVDSIKNCIVKAYETPPNPGLVSLIRREYNWQVTAERTLYGYGLALGSCR